MPYKDKEKQREYQKIYSRQWHIKNKISRNQQIRERKISNKKWRMEYIQSLNPQCKICKESDIATLDFHHDDESTKEYSISNMNSCSRKKVIQEISKCTILCSNCHRKLHFYKKNILR